MLCLFLFFCLVLLFPSPSLLAPLYIFSTCSPYFFPLFKFSPFLFLSFLSDRKDIRDKFNVSGCLVMGVWKLKEVRGMVVSRCEKGFKSYCWLSLSGKEQHPGSQFRLLPRPAMGLALFRCIHMDGKQLIYVVSLHMWKPPNCFDYSNTGRRLWKEKKQINPLSSGESWDNL